MKISGGLIGMAVLMVILVIGAITCTERVDVGHVGIRVNLAGSTRGAQDAPIVSGWVVFNPLTEDVIEFPTSMQNVVWTKSPQEGSPSDESITFTSSEGVTVNADVGFAYHILPERAGRIYTRFRADVGDGELGRVSHGFIRNQVRDILNEVASRMPVQDIYGSRKSDLLRESQRQITERLRPEGFVVDQLTFTGALRLPENVMAAINRAMEATQNAIQAENRVRQTQAEAQQNIAEAHGRAQAAREAAQGDADALLIRTRADAQAMSIRAEAESRSNRQISESLTPSVLQFRSLQRWNGILPTYMSGGSASPMPFVQIPRQ